MNSVSNLQTLDYFTHIMCSQIRTRVNSDLRQAPATAITRNSIDDMLSINNLHAITHSRQDVYAYAESATVLNLFRTYVRTTLWIHRHSDARREYVEPNIHALVLRKICGIVKICEWYGIPFDYHSHTVNALTESI